MDSSTDRERRLAPILSGSAFLASAMIGLAIGRATGGGVALWPTNAILLSALLLAPRAQAWRHVLACLAASLAANGWAGETLAHTLLVTAANMTMPVIAAALVRRCGDEARTFESLAGIGRFVLAVTVAVSAGAAIMAAGRALEGASFGAVWLGWASGSLLGNILIASIVLTVAREAAQHRGAPETKPRLAVLWPFGVLVVGTVAVFAQSRFPLLFVPLALVLMVTFRLCLSGAVVGTGVVALIGTIFLALGHGPVALVAGPIALRVHFFQLYLLVIYGTCLPLATLLAERARLARARIESDRRHRRILDRSRDVIFETDLAGRWTYLNPAWRAMVGRDPEESLGTSFLSLVVAEDRAVALERLAPMYARETDECHQELRYVRRDGGVRWASVRSYILTDERGEIVGTHGTLQDVTAAKAAEAARAESERLYRLLADNSNDMIVRIDLKGVRRYVSPASFALLGYRPEELIGDSPAGTIHPDDRPIAIATCATLLDGAEDPICTYRQLHKNGHYVWLEATYRLIRDGDGAPVEFIASVRDVGRRQQAELDRTMAAAKLLESNRVLLMAEKMGRIGHWRVDLASERVLWSDVVCAIHGVEPGYSPALAAAIDFYHPDDRAMVEATVAEARRTAREYEFSARLIRPDGTTRRIVSRGRSELGPDGTPVGLLGVFQDVTETYEAERALRDAGERLADLNRMLTMAEAVAHLGHWRVDTLDGQHFWSDEVYRIHGVPADQVPTFANALAAYHPDDRERVRALVEQAVADGADYSFRARLFRPDGTMVHIFVRGEIDRDADGRVKGLFGIIQDVSEQAESEALLRSREERFRLITEQASDMISVHDFDGCCRFMSPAARLILGYDPEALLGHRLGRVMPARDRRAMRRYRARLEHEAPGTAVTARFRMRRADGRLIWIEAVSRQARYDDRNCLIAVCRDVTGQVAAEKELHAAWEAAEDAVRARSMFLANMSHEIRTPMNGVIGFTELLLASDLTPEQRQQTELIAESGRAMMQLLNDILDLSKLEAAQMTVVREPFDLHHTLRSCSKLIAPALVQKGLALEFALAPDLPRAVLGDGLRLRQIILNLLGNAAKFTAAGRVTVRADTVDGADGPEIVIAVEDTGIGIAPERQAAIFGQFVQADAGIAARFGGTGLGLTISAQLARLMGGRLRVDSAPGRGTCFTLTLPLLLADGLPSRRTRAAGAATDADPAAHAGKRILVAEDHDVNQLLIVEMLKRLGCAADVAADGAQAAAMVAEARERGRAYRLVLMDMQMPEVDGLEATRRIRAAGIDPADLPIVALTANAYPDDIAACLAAGMQGHIGKPVNLAELEAALRRWTDEAGDAPAPPPAPATGLSDAVKARYLTRRGEALDQLDRLVRAGRFSESELGEVATTLHKLAGTAAMFGDAALGDEARALEEGLERWSPAEWASRIRAAVVAIRNAA